MDYVLRREKSREKRQGGKRKQKNKQIYNLHLGSLLKDLNDTVIMIMSYVFGTMIHKVSPESK